MNPTDPSLNQAANPYNNPLNVMSDGETVICEIRRHPFGLFGMYFIAMFIIVAAVVGAVLATHYLKGVTGTDKAYLFLAALGVSIITLLYLYLGMTVYKGNRWIVTSDSITQISQVSLFRKQTSQLSLANLEDVTFEQNSFIQTMLGFGILRVETAGERSKFSFPFCPNPQNCAQEIIRAHEDFIRQHPEEQSTSGQGVNVNAGTYAQQQPQSQAALSAPSQPSNDDHSNSPT